jgi:hypothetical protein
MIQMIKNNIIIVVGMVLVIAGFVYFNVGAAPEIPALSATSADTVQSKEDRQIIDVLLKLKEIQLRTEIFADPAFTALQDVGVDIVNEPVGRRNPFAPFAVQSTPEAAAVGSRILKSGPLR